MVGGISFISGKREQAFSLNGAAYLQIPVTPELNVGKEDGFTIDAWIDPATTDVQMPIIEYEQKLGTQDGSDVGILLYINLPPTGGSGQGCIAANLVDTAQTSHMIFSGPNLLCVGKWQHIAITYDRISGDAMIYLNGEPVANKNFGSFTAQTGLNYLLIGARTAFGTPLRPSNAFSGGLDEIGIYNRALSPAEIRGIYLEENGGDTSE